MYMHLNVNLSFSFSSIHVHVSKFVCISLAVRFSVRKQNRVYGGGGADSVGGLSAHQTSDPDRVDAARDALPDV